MLNLKKFGLFKCNYNYNLQLLLNHDFIIEFGLLANLNNNSSDLSSNETKVPCYLHDKVFEHLS